ncbi:MAG TPA: YebC/PmpR family DNA-binding transcriptional regulator, partial [Candidatus Moranbacteria bacterium]|nr:YebC/PmpR family DNA-binding transcriptional regulator [Candidatus Moranbacteria bacterium]
MSGHSHFAGIKHKKGINDAKRAKIFTKFAKPIAIAAQEGGGNPDTNFKLRMAIDKARQFNMPKENIERAIKRGTGE